MTHIIWISFSKRVFSIGSVDSEFNRINVDKAISRYRRVTKSNKIFLFFFYRFANSFKSVTKLRLEYERLKSYLSKTNSPLVFAHNDLLLGNIIYDKDEDKIHFIDYEYASYSYQAYDIANHFNEFVGKYYLNLMIWAKIDNFDFD